MSTEFQATFNQEAKIQDKIIEIIDTLHDANNNPNYKWTGQELNNLENLAEQVEDTISLFETLKTKYHKAASHVRFTEKDEALTKETAKDAILTLAYQHISMDLEKDQALIRLCD